jgi:hypothetical protein
MEQQLTEVTLTSVHGGAVPELFAHEWGRVMANIQDPNTDPQQKRSVTVTLTVEPGEDRMSGVVTVDINAKIAGPRSLKSSVHFAEKNGQPVAVTFNPNQRQLFGEDKDIKPLVPREVAQAGGRS